MPGYLYIALPLVALTTAAAYFLVFNAMMNKPGRRWLLIGWVIAGAAVIYWRMPMGPAMATALVGIVSQLLVVNIRLRLAGEQSLFGQRKD